MKTNIVDQGFESVLQQAYPNGVDTQGKEELRQMYFVGCAYTLNKLANKTELETNLILTEFRDAINEFSREEEPAREESSSGIII